jgi:uncharacterized protein YbaR (Trm112 family)
MMRPAIREARVMSESLDPELLKILACPQSKAPLVLVGNWLYSTDPNTCRRYPVRDGIPLMLIDESEVVDQAEFDRIMAEHRRG